MRRSFAECAKTEGGRRLAAAFDRAAKEGRAALVGYWMGGYPDFSMSREALLSLAEGGCDVLEVGVPFSDPVADGPVLQTAAAAALRSGTTLRRALDIAEQVVRRRPDVPVVLMTYYNPVLQFGANSLARAMARAGISGIIVPDLPLEEAGALAGELREQGRAWVSLAAPTSTGRLEKLASASDGFIYAISRPGVTGERVDLSCEARDLVDGLRRCSALPVALGFGVSGPAQATAYAWADGVVVGSAFASAWMSRAGEPGAEQAGAVAGLADALRRALARGKTA